MSPQKISYVLFPGMLEVPLWSNGVEKSHNLREEK
jgi:hypothetical protein